MQIAGIVPLSSVDWPDKLVVTVFTQGCPWDCLYCHNRDLIAFKEPTLNHCETIPASPVSSSPTSISSLSRETSNPALFHVKQGVADVSISPDPLEELFVLLEKRKGLLDGVVISGGEPLAQPGLANALARIRSLGFATGLHTGGAWPNRLKEILAAGLIDWVGLDIKALPSGYEYVVGRRNAGARSWESLEYVLETARRGRVDYEVRVTWFNEHPDPLEALISELHRAGVENLAVQMAHTPNQQCPRGKITPPKRLTDALLARLHTEFSNFTLRS